MQIDTYIRLSRIKAPVGIFLLLLPTWWGFALASHQIPDLYILFLFALGAILMRSAGCVYNDIIDKDFDKKVQRTIGRPIASGELHVRQGLTFLITLLVPAAFILFSLPVLSISIGFFALALVFIYPWMKRITYWPQLFLGLTFNIGIFIGWFTNSSSLTLGPIFLYVGAIFWTIGYDSIYAFQDREDDLLVGVKSSALVISSHPKLFLSLIYGFTLIFWIIAGFYSRFFEVYWLFLSLIAAHFAWQIATLKINIAENCSTRFFSNVHVGILLFIAIVFSRLID